MPTSSGSRPASRAPSRTRAIFGPYSSGGVQVRNATSAIAPARRSIRGFIAASTIGTSTGPSPARKPCERTCSPSTSVRSPRKIVRIVATYSSIRARGASNPRPCHCSTMIGLRGAQPGEHPPGGERGERREAHGGEHGGARVDADDPAAEPDAGRGRGDHPEHGEHLRPGHLADEDVGVAVVLGEAREVEVLAGGEALVDRQRDAEPAQHGHVAPAPSGRRPRCRTRWTGARSRPSSARSKTSTASNSTGSPAGGPAAEVDLDEDDGAGDDDRGSVRRGGPGARRGPSGSGRRSPRARAGSGRRRVTSSASGAKTVADRRPVLVVDRREVALDRRRRHEASLLRSSRHRARTTSGPATGRRTR